MALGPIWRSIVDEEWREGGSRGKDYKYNAAEGWEMQVEISTGPWRAVEWQWTNEVSLALVDVLEYVTSSGRVGWWKGIWR